jgi:hypothetical protein
VFGDPSWGFYAEYSTSLVAFRCTTHHNITMASSQNTLINAMSKLLEEGWTLTSKTCPISRVGD